MSTSTIVELVVLTTITDELVILTITYPCQRQGFKQETGRGTVERVSIAYAPRWILSNTVPKAASKIICLSGIFLLDQ
jgi:hypothetical protein